ncbi:flavin reductase family protein [Nitrogeniibacter mangrovi]|uniref:Flavin reductase family protein n=1 Tax=Nitrogeniibacter mangrovi TaxID=2016596 RepID=A0A6C1AZ74_9RHOO|nr:flavin reductase family protein [Nitrogeniibacter mangrovi]QID16433.1 flavin reductase family protein [Nitrogeniibacter mangrovi]
MTARPDSSQRALRDSLGMFATGITVVTARAPDGTPVGLTVNSFNSVSLDPPLIVWSLASHLPSVAVFSHCEYYAINVLAEDQQHLSQRFATRDIDKFAGLELRDGLGGAPLLDGCCAWFECRNTTLHDGGDHLMFVSEVTRHTHEAKPPLIYFGGRYRQLKP